MSTALVWEAKRGDTGPVFRAQCLDDTTPVNLTTATGVKFLMQNDAGTVVVNAAMIKDDQTASPGWVRRSWGPTDLAVAGRYRAEVEVTWGDGTTTTFPRDSYVTVVVTPDIGP